jgi:hypothetical protein
LDCEWVNGKATSGVPGEKIYLGVFNREGD